MLKENQKIKIKWHPQTKKYYIDLGYEYTKMRDEFEVDIKDLSKGCHAKVIAICDYCGKEYEVPYVNYLKYSQTGKDACKDCILLKRNDTMMARYNVIIPMHSEEIKEKIKQTNLQKYGVENVFQSKEIKEKIKKSNLEKYGTEYASSSPQVREKVKQTNIERYGVANPVQLDEVKEKIKNTCLERYGVEHTLQAQKVKDKIIKTNLSKYGVKYSCQADEVIIKMRQSLYKNGHVETSKAQLSVYNMLLDMYGNCELNYPCDKLSLDCLLNINDSKIDIEYDGWYWHKDKQDYDKRRDNWLIKQGYKVLRIKANMELPTEEQLKEAIDYLVKGNHSYTEIILDI